MLPINKVKEIVERYEILEKRLTEDNLPSKGLVDVLKNINNQRLKN